jgi:hypothetical protein
MTQTAKFKRYDKCDPDRRVVKLTRIGHHILRMLRENRNLASTGNENRALEEALETVWAAKRLVKAEIAKVKAKKYTEWRATRMEGGE